jgi:hypothetical protein
MMSQIMSEADKAAHAIAARKARIEAQAAVTKAVRAIESARNADRSTLEGRVDLGDRITIAEQKAWEETYDSTYERAYAEAYPKEWNRLAKDNKAEGGQIYAEST